MFKIQDEMEEIAKNDMIDGIVEDLENEVPNISISQLNGLREKMKKLNFSEISNIKISVDEDGNISTIEK